MPNPLRLLLCLGLVLTTGLPSCAAEKADGTREVTVYYRVHGELMPVTRELPASEPNPYLAATMLALQPSGVKGLVPTSLPGGTRVEWVRVENGKASLNFSKNLPMMVTNIGDPWRFIINPLVATLLEFPEVNAVEILFGGKSEKYLGESEVGGPLARRDYLGPNPIAVSTADNYGRATNLYYPTLLEGRVFVVPISVWLSESQLSIRKALELLLEDHGDMKTPFPKGVHILEIAQESGVVSVDFSRELLTATGPLCDGAIAEALRYTTSEFSGVTGVQVLVEGQAVSQIGSGGIDFSGPISVPENPPGLLPMPKAINVL